MLHDKYKCHTLLNITQHISCLLSLEIFWRESYLQWQKKTPNFSDEHHKFQLRTRAARMLSLVELPIGNLASDFNYQVCVNQESVCYMFQYIHNGAMSTLFHLCSCSSNSVLHIIIIIIIIIITITIYFHNHVYDYVRHEGYKVVNLYAMIIWVMILRSRINP